jgi:hypothetical protein
MRWKTEIAGKSNRVERTREPRGGVLALNKPCEVEDFSNPELAAVMREIYPAEARAETAWPRGRECRKRWEISMAVLAMHRGLPLARRSTSQVIWNSPGHAFPRRPHA